MIPCASPMLHAGAIQGGKTYAEWLARITTLATGGVKSWGSQLATTAGKFRTTAAVNGTGIMIGSPWQDYASRFTNVERLIQHGLPLEEVFNEQCAAGREIYYEIVSLGSLSSFSGKTRNGFTSDSSDVASLAYNCPDVRYFDPVLGPMKMNPQAGTGPIPDEW